MPDPIAPIVQLAPLTPVNLVAPTSAPGLEGVADATGATSFANLLKDKLSSTVQLQQDAANASEAVATGRSDDLTGATIAVEKASIAIELVSAIRNKAVEAYQDVMRMQI
jgi:flagellar hook-basal body complex protein FliE